MRSTVRALVWTGAIALGASGCLPDLSRFELVEPLPDAGAPDAGERDAGERDAGELDGGSNDAGSGDAGQNEMPPVDERCAVTWTALAPGRTDCPGRSVQTIAAAAAPFLLLDLALARAGDGTLRVFYGDQLNPDSSVVRALSFDEGATSAAIAPVREDVTDDVLGERHGRSLAVATAEDGVTHHLVYWNGSDSGGELLWVRYEPSGFVGEAEVVARELSPAVAGDVAVLVEPSGHVVVAYYDTVRHRTRATRFAVGGAPTIVDISPAEGTVSEGERGAVALARHDGLTHAGFQRVMTFTESIVVSTHWSIASWASPSTIDGTPRFRLGVGLGMASTGAAGELVFAYPNVQTGDVLVVRRGTSTTPETQHQVRGLDLEPDIRRYPLVLRSDARGRLHLLLANAQPSRTSLDYHHQHADGTWIVETIASFSADPDELFFDLVVDGTRPHIVYSHPVEQTLHYATVRDE